MWLSRGPSPLPAEGAGAKKQPNALLKMRAGKKTSSSFGVKPGKLCCALSVGSLCGSRFAQEGGVCVYVVIRL